MYSTFFLPFPTLDTSASQPRSGVLAIQHADTLEERISLHWVAASMTERGPGYLITDYGSFYDSELWVSIFPDEKGDGLIQAVSDLGRGSERLFAEGSYTSLDAVTWNLLEEDHPFSPCVQALVEALAQEEKKPAQEPEGLDVGQIVTMDLAALFQAGGLTLTQENFEESLPHLCAAGSWEGTDEEEIFHLFLADPVYAWETDQPRYLGYRATVFSASRGVGTLVLEEGRGIRYWYSNHEIGFEALALSEADLPAGLVEAAGELAQELGG